MENYTSSKYKNILIDNVKTLLNIFPQFNYEKNKIKMLKAINADTKQAISTIYQVGNENDTKVENTFTESQSVSDYLEQFDWSKPWNAVHNFLLYVFTLQLNILISMKNSIVLLIKK